MITNNVNKNHTTWNHKETNATLYYKEFDSHLIKCVKKKAVDHFQVSILNKLGENGEKTIPKGNKTRQHINVSTSDVCNLNKPPMPAMPTTRRTAGNTLPY